MTDREMLELAAKAYGDPKIKSCFPQFTRWIGRNEDMGCDVMVPWNPLTDDGDALRLAAVLKIDLDWQSTKSMPSEPTVEAYRSTDDGYPFFCATEPEADYRRAIVRVAAEIGKAMP